MVISSLVIETAPELTDKVARKLADIEGVEVHETNGYKVVVTIEAETIDDSHAVASGFIGIEGVTGINTPTSRTIPRWRMRARDDGSHA